MGAVSSAANTLADRPPKYWAFISYSHRDKKWADWLHSGLESYRTPAGLLSKSGANAKLPPRLFPVFRDRDELRAGGNLPDVIQRALVDSRFLIVICSPNAAESVWVNREIESFIELKGRERVLPLIVDGNPNSGDDTECFPPALRDVNAQVAAFAADTRPAADGKLRAKLKLIAVLLDIGFDDLWKRDQIRRGRRLLTAGGVLALTMMVVVGLFITTWLARNEAHAQRDLARNRRDLTLASIRETIDNISTNLKHVPAESKVKQGIIGKAMSQLDELRGSTDANDVESLDLLCSAYNQMGNTLRTQGYLPDALVQHQTALELANGFSRQTPESPQGLRHTALSHEYLCLLYGMLDDRKSLLMHQSQSLAIFEQLLAQAPDEPVFWHDASVAYSRIGTAELERGEFELALAHLEQGIELNQRWAERFPENLDARRELAVNFELRGFTYNELRNFVQAEKDYLENLRLVEEVMLQRASSPHTRNDVAHAHEKLGNLYIHRGRLSEAKSHLRECVALRRAVLAADPADHTSKSNMATALMLLGDVLRMLEQFDEVSPLYAEGLRLREELAAVFPESTMYLALLALAHESLALFHSTQNEPELAESEMKSSLAQFEKLHELDPDNSHAISDVAVLLGRLGDVQFAKEDTRAALETFRRQLDYCERLVDRHPDRAAAIYDLSKVHSRLAELYNDLHQPEQSLPHSERNLELVERMLQIDPINPQYRNLRAETYRGLAAIHALLGNTENAVASYSHEAGELNRLIQDYPEKPQYRRQYATCINKRGVLLLESNQVEAARELFQENLRINLALVAEQPDAPDYLRELGVNYSKLGLAAGSAEEALEFHRQSLQTFERVLKLRPRQIGAIRDLTYALKNTADAEFEKGNFKNAAEMLVRDLELSRQLVAADPKNLVAKRDLAFTCRKLGAMLVNESPEEAVKCFQIELEAQGAIYQTDTSNLPARLDTVICFGVCGQTAVLAGQFELAEFCFDNGRNLCLNWLDEDENSVDALFHFARFSMHEGVLCHELLKDQPRAIALFEKGQEAIQKIPADRQNEDTAFVLSTTKTLLDRAKKAAISVEAPPPSANDERPPVEKKSP